MKIVADCYIPFLRGVLEPYAEVVYAEPAEITPESVRDADALLVRTRTRVGEELLKNSKCRFVGTATIGADHIDREWCATHGIHTVNAPGCNAPAVAQYVMSAICRLTDWPLDELTLGIIGVGNVGGLVARWAQGLGMKTLLVDPPRQLKEGGHEWSTMADVARLADIITFHTPLTRKGPHATYHLADSAFFDSLCRRPVIINSSRGAVVDNVAWLKAIADGRISRSVVDVWEGEPAINTELMIKADIATPHIAGYSLDGKIRATRMVLDELTAFFGLPALKPDSREACAVPDTVTRDMILHSYNPFEDTAMMRRVIDSARDKAKAFEQLRDNYDLRHEISWI